MGLAESAAEHEVVIAGGDLYGSAGHNSGGDAVGYAASADAFVRRDGARPWCTYLAVTGELGGEQTN